MLTGGPLTLSGMGSLMGAPVFGRLQSLVSARRRVHRDASLFPLNRRWRFSRNVIDHPVDAAHLVDDPVGGLSKKFVG